MTAATVGFDIVVSLCNHQHPLRVMFWNVGKASIAPAIAAVAHDEDVDLLVLAESDEPIARLSIALNRGQKRQFSVPPGVPPDLRRAVRVLTRLPSGAVEPLFEDHGIAVRRVRSPIGVEFVLIGVHLRSKLNIDPADQTFITTRLSRVIERWENRVGHRRTVVVGDLNMDPFERGVVAADGLHAVMTRRVAVGGHRQVDDEDRPFLYNPMWNHFGDRSPSPPGTFYRGPAGYTSYFWHMFDQVLVRPDLLPYFEDDSLRIVTSAGGVSLITAAGIPDKANFSDHLPIVFELSVEKGSMDGEPVGEDQRAGV